MDSFEAGVDNYCFKPIDEKIFFDKLESIWKKYQA